jgi:hypothetical protein
MSEAKAFSVANDLNWEKCELGDWKTQEEIEARLGSTDSKLVLPTDEMVEAAFMNGTERAYYNADGQYIQSNRDAELDHAEWHLWLENRDAKIRADERQKVLMAIVENVDEIVTVRMRQMVDASKGFDVEALIKQKLDGSRFEK